MSWIKALTCLIVKCEKTLRVTVLPYTVFTNISIGGPFWFSLLPSFSADEIIDNFFLLLFLIIVEPVTLSPKGFLEGFGGRFPPLLLLGLRLQGILLTVVDELQTGVDVASESHQLVVRFPGARENMQVLLIDFATYLLSLSLDGFDKSPYFT